MGLPSSTVLFVLLLGLLKLTLGDREHKIHNIVLYPDRESWCKTQPIKQIVAMPGYEPITIENNVCVGACYSYSIPRTQPAEPGELIGPYCDSCQPVDTKCYHVTLKADENNSGPRTIQKRIQRIDKCSCMSCDKIENRDAEIMDQCNSELPASLSSNLNVTTPTQTQTKATLNDVPDLLHITPHNRTSVNQIEITNTTQSKPKIYELNEGLIKLLKFIQSEDEDDDDESSNLSYGREQLKELLEIVEGPEHELSDKNLMDFVNFVNVHNSEDLEIDLSKLKEVLTAFRRDQELMEKHRNFGLGTTGTKPVQDDPLKINIFNGLGSSERNNADINRDIENLVQKYNIPKTYGLEGSHLGLGHYKGSHIGMGIKTNNLINGGKSKTEPVVGGKGLNEPGLGVLGGKGHHHAGDEIRTGGETGHLERGPHGSLTFVPDVKLKLNLDSNLVKPNQEGIVISYENEPKK